MVIDDFLAHLAVERQASAHTLDAYRRDLGALAGWARGRDLLALDGNDLRTFVAAEHRRGLSPKSLQRRLSACRSLYRWLLKQGRLPASPADGVRAPKAPRKLPQVLDVDEAVQLVQLPTDAPLGLREAVDGYQRQLIVSALGECAGNWTQAAKRLGVDRANLQRLARRLGIPGQSG